MSISAQIRADLGTFGYRSIDALELCASEHLDNSELTQTNNFKSWRTDHERGTVFDLRRTDCAGAANALRAAMDSPPTRLSTLV